MGYQIVWFIKHPPSGKIKNLKCWKIYNTKNFDCNEILLIWKMIPPAYLHLDCWSMVAAVHVYCCIAFLKNIWLNNFHALFSALLQKRCMTVPAIFAYGHTATGKSAVINSILKTCKVCLQSLKKGIYFLCQFLHQIINVIINNVLTS